jgi:diguanylate cyclase (GGDEF)-like protein
MSIKKIILIVVFIIAALMISQSIYYANIEFEKKNNHQQAEKILSTDIKFSWDKLDSQLKEINKLINTGHFYNEDLGLLYERASLIYLQKGETMNYYKYLGYALHYLEGSEEKDYTINIYLDIANFFLNNYSNDAAEEMLNKAQAIEPFEEIENPRVQSYAYRMLGIMSFLNLNYNDAETYFITSQKIIDQSHTDVFEEEYTAMNDVWLARVYEETGRLSKCKEKLDKWADHEMFTTEVYRKILLRDFIIPYYQAKCYYLCAENIKERSSTSEMDTDAREQAVINYLHEFMELCEENQYEKAELYTLLKIQREYPTKNQAIQSELYYVLNQLYSTLFNQQNITYSSVINGIVNDASNELASNELSHRYTVKRIKIMIISTLVLCLLILSFILLLFNNQYDGLTKLLTRKVFNKDLNRAKRSKAYYGIIMMDIDNFKNINDTYGHPEGDIVLWRLGQLIAKETTSGIQGYRYGGEEFILLVGKNDIAYVPKIAERVRQYMEQQSWDFAPGLVITLSVGTAIGSGHVDVLKEADNNLYYSKTHGKNQVKSTESL